MTEIAEHLKTEHGFILDSSRTLLYGTCAECASANADNENN